jgi:hypothetical protein
MQHFTDKKQSEELLKIKDFPDPDFMTIINVEESDSDKEQYLFNPSEIKIKKNDIKCWSIGRMIEGLPKSFIFNACLEDDDEDVEYFLIIRQKARGNFWEVCYISENETKILHTTKARELIDALFKMIMTLKTSGWYKIK